MDADLVVLDAGATVEATVVEGEPPPPAETRLW
jgi:hypothetical protein